MNKNIYFYAIIVLIMIIGIITGPLLLLVERVSQPSSPIFSFLGISAWSLVLNLIAGYVGFKQKYKNWLLVSISCFTVIILASYYILYAFTEFGKTIH